MKNKKSTPLPSILHWGVFLFSTGSWNSGTTFQGGGGGWRALFRPFHIGKTSERSFRAKCLEQSLLILCYLLLGEACLERRVQVPSDLLYIRLSIQISSLLFLVQEGKINFVQASRMDLLSKSPFHYCSWNC